MTRPIPQIALDFLMQAEACRLTAYKDSGGVWTIGVGHTGPEVKAGLRVSQAVAAGYLQADAGIAATRLAAVVDDATLSRLTDHQYAALISFVFNLGASPKWTIWKVLKAGKLDQVPGQMQRFINDNGKVVPGLVNRRAAEVALWRAPDSKAALVALATIPQVVKDAAPPSSQTVRADTQPTPVPAKPLGGASLTAKVVTLTAAAGGVAEKVVHIVQPHVSISPIFAQIVVGCTGVVIVAAVAGLWISHEQEKARAH